MNTATLITAAGQLLGEPEKSWNPDSVQVAVLVPDGSSRRFFQLRTSGGRR